MKQFPKAILVACLLAGACGGGGGGERPPSPTPERPPASPPPDGPPTPGTAIRGGERLGWDQSGPSQAAVQAFSYLLYVDGSARPLADVRCAAATGSGYPCSGQLPALLGGAHVLELAAVDGGIEGPRSAPFRVNVSLSALGTTADDMANAAMPAPQARIVCLDAAVDECYDAATIATAAGDVADLTVAPDGRVFFVENARAVRVIGAEGLSAPALIAEAGERIVSLALSPDFLQSRFVYVGSVEERRGGPEFTVRRLREIAGVLGQAAALVTGLPVHDVNARVPIAVDDSERLYVALPAASESATRLSSFAFNGHVLRFAADGSVPANQTSPILARGYERPSALVYEATRSRLWLAGSSGPWKTPVAIIPTGDGADAGPRGSESQPRAVLTSSPQPSLGVPAVALRSHDGALELWLADGESYRGSVVNGVVQTLESVETGLGDLAGIAATPQKGLYVVVRDGGTGAVGTEIVRLVPRSPALIQ